MSVEPYGVSVSYEPKEFRGIKDANDDWVIRFDYDYGTDQLTTAREIIQAVNAQEKLKTHLGRSEMDFAYGLQDFVVSIKEKVS